MTYVQFPYETLVSLGQNLQTLSDKLQGDHRGAADVAGLTDDHAEISNAISDFRDEWKSSLLELMTNIGTWGGLSEAIGKLVADFDAQTAAALRPDGG
ncbi:hypothetical protein ACNTMW_20185 [Planosporangium sp. 12N6]|uniref:hypothetical protein n=1 Tax=Planosporangium spinosum TaxID=3402278 RepID=UPI003CEF5D94